MPPQFHEIPEYRPTSFWTTLLLAYQEPHPGQILAEIGEVVVESLLESRRRFFTPTHLLNYDGPQASLYVLGQEQLRVPFVQILYHPASEESPERTHIRIQPLDRAGDHYRWTLIGKIAPLTDEYVFEDKGFEIIVRRAERDLFSSGVYPAGLGIEGEEAEASPLYLQPDDEVDDLGDHLGFD